MIGNYDNAGSGSSIYSQLPYTVDVETLSGGLNGAVGGVDATFKYAGGTYGSGHGDYAEGDCSSGFDECLFFRVAFPCPGF